MRAYSLPAGIPNTEVTGQGDKMYRRGFLISSLFLTTALLAPAAIRANPAPQGRVRVYDRDHKDYHNWDDNENRYYHRYYDENHREYRDYSKLKRRDQDDYWKWRHEHEDDRH